MLKMSNLRVSTSVLWGWSGLTGPDYQIGGIRWVSQIEAHAQLRDVQIPAAQGASSASLQPQLIMGPKMIQNDLAICMPEMGTW